MAIEAQILANSACRGVASGEAGPSTSVEMPLQISSFMQNKPNFQKSQMNANLYNTTDYERKRDWTLGENKPNTNPIKANLRKAKMNIDIRNTYEQARFS